MGRKGGKSSSGDRDRIAGVTDAAAVEEEDMERRKDGRWAFYVRKHNSIIYQMEKWDTSRNQIVCHI